MQSNDSDNGITFRWLGISGVELRCGSDSLMIDPVYTRIPLRKVLFSRLQPDTGEIQRHHPSCSSIFITHSHYDHLLDAPEISRLSGATIYGSPNTCAIARKCGVEEGSICAVQPGVPVQAGCFTATAWLASHIRLPLHGAGPVAERALPPLRSREYRMDGSLTYLVQACGRKLLIGPGVCQYNGKVDAVFCSPTGGLEQLKDYLEQTRPSLFMPIHWDDMFQPARCQPKPGISPALPPRRFDLQALERLCHAASVRFLLPDMEREYQLDYLL